MLFVPDGEPCPRPRQEALRHGTYQRRFYPRPQVCVARLRECRNIQPNALSCDQVKRAGLCRSRDLIPQ